MFRHNLSLVCNVSFDQSLCQSKCIVATISDKYNRFFVHVCDAPLQLNVLLFPYSPCKNLLVLISQTSPYNNESFTCSIHVIVDCPYVMCICVICIQCDLNHILKKIYVINVDL